MPSDPWTKTHPLYNLTTLQEAIQREHPTWRFSETLALAVRVRKELHKLHRSWARNEKTWRKHVVLNEIHCSQSSPPTRNWRV